MSALVRAICEEYQSILDILTENELLIDSNPLVRVESSSAIRVSWRGNGGLAYLFADHSSIDQYVQMLNRRDFSLCFFDGSLVQINYLIDKNGIVSHRLCFVPCPYGYSAGDWGDISLAEIPYLMSGSDLLQDARLASPIRFDFDATFSDEKHAHAHLSLNKSACRIPMYGPVSLGHFFRFIFRYFFENLPIIDLVREEVRPRFFVRTLDREFGHEFHLDSAQCY